MWDPQWLNLDEMDALDDRYAKSESLYHERQTIFSAVDPPDIVSGPPMTEHFILTTVQVDSLIK